MTFLMRAAACYANRTSVIHEGTRFTWGQTYERCRRLAFSLRALNVAKNDVVSVTISSQVSQFLNPLNFCIYITKYKHQSEKLKILIIMHAYE